jgi:hypothetical protein
LLHSGIRTIIRTTAIALIIFPEPVTTAIGVIMLSATFAIPGQKSLKKFGDLESLVKISFQNSEPLGFRRFIATEQAVVKHVMKTLPSQISEPKGESETMVTSQRGSRFDHRPARETVLLDTLKTSIPQYQAVSKVVQKSGLKSGQTRHSEPSFEHHKLKLVLPAEPHQCLSKTRVPTDNQSVLHHKLKMN